MAQGIRACEEGTRLQRKKRLSGLHPDPGHVGAPLRLRHSRDKTHVKPLVSLHYMQDWP